MSEATVVDARLDKLEQDNRRLKLMFGALLFVMAGGGLIIERAMMPEEFQLGIEKAPLVGAVIPGQIPDVIQARRFEVIDENGTLRTLMDGKTIAYLDENRVTRSQLYVDGFFYSDASGNVVWNAPER